MKAITCTQCGATLENVSPLSTIITCEYCGARIMMTRDEPEKPKPPVPVEPPDLDLDASPQTPFFRIGVVAGLALLIPVLFVWFAAIKRESKAAKVSAYTVSSTPYPSTTPSSWNWIAENKNPDRPLPVVNYQPRVAWDGPDDMEYFADPEVDVSSVSNLTSEEIKKTVFKDRVVKLRVVVNTAGEIDQVETISGHPILVQAATESAKRSIFRSRSKPTTRVLTYTFRVLKD